MIVPSGEHFRKRTASSLGIYSRLRNKRRGTLIIFLLFFPVGTCLSKGVRLLTFLFFLSLKYFFLLLFLQLRIRKSKYLLFQEGVTLIQGAMFIVFDKDSRGYDYSRGYVHSGV